MRALASFAMRNRSYAIMVATVSTMLAVIVPPLAYVGSGTIGLVTLRQGPRAGLWVIVGAFAALFALGLLILGNPKPAFFFVVGLWVPLWIVARVLRQTQSLALALEVNTALALLVLVVTYMVLGDPVSAWREMLGAIAGPALEQAGIAESSVEVKTVLDQAARLMNGVFAASFAFSVMLSLILARWWQAQLYNPGGLRREFHALRLHRRVAPVALAVVVLAWLLPGDAGQFMVDVSFTLSVLYLLQGLAVVHGLVGLTGANVGWLVGMYALMIVALPQLLMLLAALGLIDAGVDLRGRFHKPTT